MSLFWVDYNKLTLFQKMSLKIPFFSATISYLNCLPLTDCEPDIVLEISFISLQIKWESDETL